MRLRGLEPARTTQMRGTSPTLRIGMDPTWNNSYASGMRVIKRTNVMEFSMDAAHTNTDAAYITQ
jgi:hypothetical protein